MNSDRPVTSLSEEHLIWRADQLRRFLSHKSPEIVAWALQRLHRQDAPAACSAAPALLAHGDHRVHDAALEILSHQPGALGEPTARALAAFARRAEVAEHLKARARAILADTQDLDEAAVVRRFRELAEQDRAYEVQQLALRYPAACHRELVRLLREATARLSDETAEVLLPVLLEPEDVPLLLDRLRALDDEDDRQGAAEALLGAAGAGDLLFGEHDEPTVDDLVAVTITERCVAAGVDAAGALPTRCCRPVQAAMAAEQWSAAVRAAREWYSQVPGSDVLRREEAMGAAILQALANEPEPDELHAKMALEVLLDRSCRSLMLGAITSGDITAVVRLLPLASPPETRLLKEAAARMWDSAPEGGRERARLTGVLLDLLGPEEPDDDRADQRWAHAAAPRRRGGAGPGGVDHPEGGGPAGKGGDDRPDPGQVDQRAPGRMLPLHPGEEAGPRTRTPPSSTCWTWPLVSSYRSCTSRWRPSITHRWTWQRCWTSWRPTAWSSPQRRSGD